MAANQERPQFRALLFDAFGTLLDPDSITAACEEAFPGRGEALSRLWRTKQLEYSWLLTLMDRYEDFRQVTERALTYASKAQGLSLDASVRDRLMAAYGHLKVFPEVPEALAALSGHTLAILSNGSSRMLEVAVENTNLTGTFSHLISVEDVRVYKPAPVVYRYGLERLGLDVTEVGFVSSNSFDVAGARSFGLWTCWVRRGDAPLDELGFQPDLAVRDLTRLAEALRG